MAVIYTPESEFGKELLKWEQRESALTYAMGGLPSGQRYRYQHFPHAMYIARRKPNGTVACQDPTDERWSSQCYNEAKDEAEYGRLMEAGWRPTQGEAFALFEAKENALSEAAANRAHGERSMSEAAKREIEAAEASTAEQLPEIPRKRGRPRKQAVQES